MGTCKGHPEGVNPLSAATLPCADLPSSPQDGQEVVDAFGGHDDARDGGVVVLVHEGALGERSGLGELDDLVKALGHEDGVAGHAPQVGHAVGLELTLELRQGVGLQRRIELAHDDAEQGRLVLPAAGRAETVAAPRTPGRALLQGS